MTPGASGGFRRSGTRDDRYPLVVSHYSPACRALRVEDSVKYNGPQVGVMGYGGYAFVAIATAVILLAAVSQVLSYRRGQSFLARGQLLLRLGTALALLAVLGLTVHGTTVQARWSARELARPEALSLARGAAAYWTAVLLLLVAAIVMALLDLRYVRAAQHRLRATMYRNLARLQAELRAEAERRKIEGKEEDGD